MSIPKFSTLKEAKKYVKSNKNAPFLAIISSSIGLDGIVYFVEDEPPFIRSGEKCHAEYEFGRKI